MRLILLFSLFLSTTALAAVEPGEAVKKPLTFSVWKQKKIQSAYKNYRGKIQAYQQQNNENIFQKRQKYQQAHKAYLVLQYSRRLSVNDYFEMYLVSKFPNNIKALTHAVQSMKEDQIAQILAAYEKNLAKRQLKRFNSQ